MVRSLRKIGVTGVMILVAAAGASQTFQDGPAQWKYWTHETALETKKALVLVGQVENGGASWTIARYCWTGLPVLQSKAASQGGALDIDHVYKDVSLRKDCGAGGCKKIVYAWFYKTRYRVDSGPLGNWRWRYGWDSDGGWEQLWLKEGWSGNDEDGWTAHHSMDKLLSGNRLAIEISPSVGVVVFNTAGFEEARAAFCGDEPMYR